MTRIHWILVVEAPKIQENMEIKEILEKDLSNTKA